MYQLMYHGEIQSCDDAIVQIDHEKEAKQIFETAVRWLPSGSVRLTRSLPTKQTMCPDVFRGPWGGSHCRDSPVQTIRDCNCAQGTRTHMCGSMRLCLPWANPCPVVRKHSVVPIFCLSSGEILMDLPFPISNYMVTKLCFLNKQKKYIPLKKK